MYQEGSLLKPISKVLFTLKGVVAELTISEVSGNQCERMMSWM